MWFTTPKNLHYYGHFTLHPVKPWKFSFQTSPISPSILGKCPSPIRWHITSFFLNYNITLTFGLTKMGYSTLYWGSFRFEFVQSSLVGIVPSWDIQNLSLSPKAQLFCNDPWMLTYSHVFCVVLFCIITFHISWKMH